MAAPTGRAPAGADTSAKPRARLRGLDGLRFFAAFAVVLYHFAAFDSYSDAVWGESVQEVTGPAGVWFGYGALAPSLFFVISYIGLSVPVIVAGVAAAAWDLRTASLLFTAAVAVLTLAAMAISVRLGRRASQRP